MVRFQDHPAHMEHLPKAVSHLTALIPAMVAVHLSLVIAQAMAMVATEALLDIPHRRAVVPLHKVMEFPKLFHKSMTQTVDILIRIVKWNFRQPLRNVKVQVSCFYNKFLYKIRFYKRHVSKLYLYTLFFL